MAKPKSDLGTRALSAIVMVAVAGAVLWVGGPVFTVFVGLIALGLLWEWWGLVSKFTPNPLPRALWMLGGLAYIGQATMALVALRHSGLDIAAMVIVTVIAIDIGAYFAGRTFGGPKIAPSVSPSKTWSGLAGGAIAASLLLLTIAQVSYSIQFRKPDGLLDPSLFGLHFLLALVAGTAFAIVAQAGDFFESWMKRRAGVKDSGNLIPGHGGLLDRADGMLAVLCFVALIYRFFPR